MDPDLRGLSKAQKAAQRALQPHMVGASRFGGTDLPNGLWSFSAFRTTHPSYQATHDAQHVRRAGRRSQDNEDWQHSLAVIAGVRERSAAQGGR